MRLLIVSAAAPVPPMNGFKLQLNHLCRELAADHQVCVLAFAHPQDRGEPPAGVELRTVPLRAGSPPRRVVLTARALVGRRPRRALMLTPAMSGAIRELLATRSFDVAHVAGSALAGVAPQFGGMPAVLAALDAWHLNVAASANVASWVKRPLYRLEARAVRRFASRAYACFDRVVVVSEADASALRALDPKLDLEVVPNGVDSRRFAPNPEIPREPGLVVFTGQMQWAPNAEAARFLVRRVLPLILDRAPGVRMALVGRGPGQAVRSLAGHEGVEVTGEVPDIRPWLWRASAFACPMVSGTGIKNKLLEALACGTPAVATSLSCQGLGIVPGEHLLVADGADAFADSLAGLLADDAKRDRLARAGRAFAEDHGWGAVAGAYERIYAEIAR